MEQMFWSCVVDLCHTLKILYFAYFCLNLQAQYCDWIKFFEAVSKYKIYMEVSHLRPIVSVSKAPHWWWQYAAQAGLRQKKMR